ncbi:MAG: thioredoxin domain-containing protein [Flavobacteriales bacterium]|nr:thioredoxin domain-containing protein [Flavobacteriales bacterium]MCB9448051.1 thioredoxin domain-containing protein [Flavobacteriales bacterium]
MVTNKTSTHTNALIAESSPYLLQHAHNPVNWFPWSDASLGKAKEENKLIIVSIGYAACHWCHVMEHESFEDTDVADVMNLHYVSIKVDREERPDIDQVYMDAIHLMGQQGGWPLNIVALPDGRPVFGGTYFRKGDWLRVLEFFAKLYADKPHEMVTRAGEITAGLQPRPVGDLPQTGPVQLDDLHDAVQSWLHHIDFERGGSSGAPKFPMPNGYRFLLHYHHLTGHEMALEAVHVTLDHMAMGGIYDQVGGGFARYSTDAEWFAPHFEKMLYDNAQLVSLYAEAWQVTGNERYKQVVEETLAFVERELDQEEGGFFSSLDADSEGHEGRFYVWTADAFKAALGEEADAAMQVFHVRDTGNWEDNHNILYLEELMPVSTEQMQKWKEKLLQARSTCERPGLDDKVLASWNALMINGFLDAYQALGEERYLNRGLKCARFIRTQMMQDGKLFRNYKNGKATIPGFLDDYALVIEAWLNLFQVTGDATWLEEADLLTGHVERSFADDSSPMFFYTSAEDTPLITRSREISDNVIPASNSVMARNLYVIGQLTENQQRVDRSAAMLESVKPMVLKHPIYHSNWAILMAWLAAGTSEVVATGPEAVARIRAMMRTYHPDVLYAGATSESNLPIFQNRFVKQETWMYVCRNRVCGLPVRTVEEAENELGIRN